MSLATHKFQELLAKARRLAAQKKEQETVAALDTLKAKLQKEKIHNVDMSLTGVSDESLETKEGREVAVDIIAEIMSSYTPLPEPSNYPLSINYVLQDTTPVSAPEKLHLTGVAANVELNAKQELFVTTALQGDDLVLVGSAGTGKTTVTGRFLSKLSETGKLTILGENTKHLRSHVPGVLIVSFTRKAVNNIKRATPDLLKPHVLTIHKVLEFAPVFYEKFDEKVGEVRKTMRFEPQKTASNPLPRGITHVIHEESSMEGLDLYQLLAAALPHNPQEIFIGDIRQLPPIFGPAILGFKMSLLPVVELTEIYRQALLSPIIRLCRDILSGDSSLFSAKVEERDEVHEFTGKHQRRKFVPSLENFNEESEHGLLKIQIWQKKLPSDVALRSTVLQFIAWERNGYYKPEEDIILCPFNVSYGCVELNKGIQDYLGRKRGAVVNEIISGMQKHYLAIGDRVLYDKEDAVITNITRSATYLGKSPQPASIHLNRWGLYDEKLGEVEIEKDAEESKRLAELATEDFFLNFSEDEDEDRVNVASHSITVRYNYSDEEVTLTTAGEVNAILGGNALTVHKMQGSENETIFFLLHHSHAAMIQNELLYTGCSRARKKLHIICEIDTFFKGVKSHKVRGVTLKDKVEYFKGKVEYKKMQETMETLNKQNEVKMQSLSYYKRERG